jgi:mono/diheme cytochrome c family protein
MNDFRRQLVLYAALTLSACGPVSEQAPDESEKEGLQRLLDRGPAMVDVPDVRRKVLRDSLVDPDNGYSRLRLEEYGLGDEGWDTLPERNFPVRQATVDDVGALADNPYATSEGEFEPIFDRAEFQWTDEHLRELGRRAFHGYPLSTDPSLSAAFRSDEDAEELGLWKTDDGRLGGFVRARLPDGSETFAATCASCHASVVDGRLVDGRTNPNIDRGGMIRRFHGGRGSEWGPGQADVTADGMRNPTAITDLRPVSRQRHLHWAATLKNSPEALAVRVETLMTTSANQAMRPPREVAIALAYYLWSLGEEEPSPDFDSRGAEVFEQNCASCHRTDGSTAPPVDVAMIGTDDAVGASPMRGTGQYRIPSLHQVGSRSQFLHRGRIKSLEALFSEDRLEETPGHTYGTNLDPSDREALIEFLKSL